MRGFYPCLVLLRTGHVFPNTQAERMSLPVVTGSRRTLPGSPNPRAHTCIFTFPILHLFLFPVQPSRLPSAAPVPPLKKGDQSLLCGASHPKLVADLGLGGPWDQGIFIFKQTPRLQLRQPAPHRVRALASGKHPEPAILLKIK